jgi:hypothetical protein
MAWTEDEEHVLGVVTAHVTAWQRDHTRRWRLPSPGQVTKAIEAAVGVVETVRQIPEVRQLATTVSQAVRERFRRRRSPPAPPPAAP